MIKKSYFSIAVLFIIAAASVYYWHSLADTYKTEPAGSNIQFETSPIKTIQYEEIKESSGAAEGRNVTDNIVTYKYPDKLRIENIGKTRIIEIYNKNKYISYNEGENKIHVKECFPKEDPYVTEIESKMNQIIEKEDYEFYGFEEIGNIKLRVIAKKYKMDGNNYMHKLWIGNVNSVDLLFKEEYFIDNVVVSKTTYTFMKVNEEINDNIFSMESLPKTKIISDGALPQYVDEYNDAQKLLNFKLILPQKPLEGYVPAEIAVIPPVEAPKFYCIYYNSNGRRLYLNESIAMVEFNPNAIMDNMDCEIRITGENVLILWKQGKVYISINSDINEYNNAVSLAESITKSRLVKK